MMNRAFYPVSGRLIARYLAKDSGFLMGCLTLPAEFSVVEGAGYLAQFLPGSAPLRIQSRPLDAGWPGEVDGYGVEACLTHCSWPVLRAHPGWLQVRLIEAFPQSNTWAVLGASRHLAQDPEAPADVAGHTWYDAQPDGGLTRIKPLAKAEGFAAGQLLTLLAVWPDASGVLHSLSQHSSKWRPRYLRLSQITARLGAGEITESEFIRLIREDRELDRIRPVSIEPAYARYLAVLRNRGELRVDEPCTAEEFTRRLSIAETAIESESQ